MPETLNVGPESSDKSASSTAGPKDLSDEINAAMAREPGEIVRCVWLFDDSYRCNWWKRADAPAGSVPVRHDLEVAEMRVRRSSFLKVKREGRGLSINGVTSPIPR